MPFILRCGGMEVVAVLGERLYHALGSECHLRLEREKSGPLLTLTAAQAREVGMEPCGYCLAPDETKIEG